jgi:hypothetical protein
MAVHVGRTHAVCWTSCVIQMKLEVQEIQGSLSSQSRGPERSQLAAERGNLGVYREHSPVFNWTWISMCIQESSLKPRKEQPKRISGNCVSRAGKVVFQSCLEYLSSLWRFSVS